MMCGGASDVKQVDDEVKAIFEEIKAELQAKTETTGEFEIHGYKTQIVAGTNYFIRCSAAGKFVHARVFKVSCPLFNSFYPILATPAHKTACVAPFRSPRRTNQRKFCSRIFLKTFFI